MPLAYTSAFDNGDWHNIEISGITSALGRVKYVSGLFTGTLSKFIVCVTLELLLSFCIVLIISSMIFPGHSIWDASPCQCFGITFHRFAMLLS